MAMIQGVRRAAGVLAGVLATLGAAGCATPGPVYSYEDGGVRPGGYPDDLALEVTVFRHIAKAPRFRRYSCVRHVLLADGSLHWGSRAGPNAAWFPAYRRTLVTEQVAALWRLIEANGLGEEASGPPVNPALLEPDPGGATCHAVVTGGGRRWAHGGRLDGEAANAQLALLVSRLDTLAWAPP